MTLLLILKTSWHVSSMRPVCIDSPVYSCERKLHANRGICGDHDVHLNCHVDAREVLLKWWNLRRHGCMFLSSILRWLLKLQAGTRHHSAGTFLTLGQLLSLEKLRCWLRVALKVSCAWKGPKAGLLLRKVNSERTLNPAKRGKSSEARQLDWKKAILQTGSLYHPSRRLSFKPTITSRSLSKQIMRASPNAYTFIVLSLLYLLWPL